jgi:hypothetical protein
MITEDLIELESYKKEIREKMKKMTSDEIEKEGYKYEIFLKIAKEYFNYENFEERIKRNLKDYLKRMEKKDWEIRYWMDDIKKNRKQLEKIISYRINGKIPLKEAMQNKDLVNRILYDDVEKALEVQKKLNMSSYDLSTQYPEKRPEYIEGSQLSRWLKK